MRVTVPSLTSQAFPCIVVPCTAPPCNTSVPTGSQACGSIGKDSRRGPHRACNDVLHARILAPQQLQHRAECAVLI